MMTNSKEELYDNFIEWTTFTEDRISQWKKDIPNEVSSKLDWSPESLLVVEEYLLDNYVLEDQQDIEKRSALDAIVSYVGDLIRKNIPETIWKIELEDETNIFYNLPYLVFKLGVPLSPHKLVQDALTEKAGNEMLERYQQRFKKWQQYKAYVESKNS